MIFKDPDSLDVYDRRGRFSMKVSPDSAKWQLMWWQSPRQATGVSYEPTDAEKALLKEAWEQAETQLSAATTQPCVNTDDEAALGNVGLHFEHSTMMVKNQPFLLKEGTATDRDTVEKIKAFLMERVQEMQEKDE